MIIFKSIRYQNFLSTGNYFNEIDLKSYQTTLIVGKNGAGKSTIVDSLTYALYGKAFRSINLDQLINSITGKNMLVELDFSVGKDDFRIRRGLKPTVFEIFKNGEMKKQEGTKEDQKYLEERVLKMNFKSFSQNVVLGPTNYTPFMQLTAGDRRKIVENLLNIQIFTTMNEVLKIKVSDNVDDIKELESKIAIIESKIESEQKHIESLSQDNDKTIKTKEGLVDDYLKSIEKSKDDLKSLQADIDKLYEVLPDSEKLKSKRNKLLGFEASIEEKLRAIRTEIKFFENHDDCPTCQQGIDHEFKTGIVEKHFTKSNSLSDALIELEGQVLAIDEQMSIINAKNQEISALNSKITEINQEIRSSNRFVTLLNEEIDELRAKAKTMAKSTDIKGLTSELKSFNKDKESLVNQKALLNVAGKLLKDSGIKTKIISQYIPVINKLLNQYLEKLDLFVEFNLDENFKETVKSRYRDKFSYESFSEGQKARLNLAILFTWRTVARLRNSVSTNLLLMDEVLDSATDLAGIDALMEIIHTTGQNENVVIISHSEKYNDQFQRIITFEEVSNFSHITEVSIDE